MRICSFTFQQMSSPVRVPYRSKAGNKYAGQVEPRASRLSEEDGRLASANGRIAE
jgi:dCTP deaminase